MNESNSLDAQAHAWAAGESDEPVVQVGCLEPALRNKLVGLGEDVGVVMDKSATARHNGLTLSVSMLHI